jgi:hypothetical protein
VNEELKKAAYLGLNVVDFEDHFPRSTPPCTKLSQRGSLFSASKRWRLLNSYDLLPDFIAGVQFNSQDVAA